MRYIVMIRRTATGYSADVPDLPGCVATGLTVEHTRHQIAEAVEGHLEVTREHGHPAPMPMDRLDFSVDDDMGEEYCTWVEVEEGEPVSSARATPAATKSRMKRKRS